VKITRDGSQWEDHSLEAGIQGMLLEMACGKAVGAAEMKWSWGSAVARWMLGVAQSKTRSGVEVELN